MFFVSFHMRLRAASVSSFLPCNGIICPPSWFADIRQGTMIVVQMSDEMKHNKARLKRTLVPTTVEAPARDYTLSFGAKGDGSPITQVNRMSPLLGINIMCLEVHLRLV